MFRTQQYSTKHINSNLTEKSVSVWTSAETNPASISCKLKNNCIVLNGHLVYPTNVAPGATVTVGTVGDSARPKRTTTILVAVLGSDAKTLGLAVGSINVNGLIIVGNPLNINARHFYFDAVWDV